MKNKGNISTVALYVASLGLAYGCLGLLLGVLRLRWAPSVTLVSPTVGLYSFLLSLCLFLVLRYAKSQADSVSVSYPLSLAALWCIALLFISDFFQDRFTFFHPSFSVFDMSLAGIVFSSVLLYFASNHIRTVSIEWLVLLVLGATLSGFYYYVGDRLVFSDDHPSFLYRFQLLRDAFPLVPFYNTDWNAGYSAREFFPSGILNVFLLFWPVVYFGGDWLTYESILNYNLVFSLYIFVLPWATYLAGRVLRFDRAASSLAALLSLGPSLTYFEWLLQYGTLGFNFSVAVTPLCIALCYRLAFDEERPRLVHVLSLLVVSFCCISWSLSALVLVPVSIAGLVCVKRVFRRDRRKLLFIFFALFVVINAPWMRIFIRESKVFSFVSGSTLPGSNTRIVSHDQSPGSGAEEVVAGDTEGSLMETLAIKQASFSKDLRKINPVLLLFSIPGFFLITSPALRVILGGSIAWLFLVAVVGDALKPQLELRRMIIPASFVMTLLAGLGLAGAFRAFAERYTDVKGGVGGFSYWCLSALLCVAIIISPVSAAGHYTNLSTPLFRFSPPYFMEFADAIREHGGSGRTFFLSFILQDFGAATYDSQDGGHIAPLAQLSGKELYASDFYHSRWSSVDPIPLEFRSRGHEGIEEFLDLVNVTAVVTFRGEWKRYCLRHSDIYTPVFERGRFNLFTRKTETDRFLEGKGTLVRARDGFTVEPESETAVLRYRYHPRLRISPPGSGEIYPVFAFKEERGGGSVEDVSFIGLKGLTPGQSVHVGFFNR